MSLETDKSAPAPASSSSHGSSWTSISLHDALRKGTVVMKENTDGKADCWNKFRLLETSSGDAIFWLGGMRRLLQLHDFQVTVCRWKDQTVWNKEHD